jgi:hypothetical protein
MQSASHLVHGPAAWTVSSLLVATTWPLCSKQMTYTPSFNLLDST